MIAGAGLAKRLGDRRVFRDVDVALPDDGLLLLSNMDARSVREIRRAITLWKYRRWQENGFAATGDD